MFLHGRGVGSVFSRKGKDGAFFMRSVCCFLVYDGKTEPAKACFSIGHDMPSRAQSDGAERKTKGRHL